MKVSRINTFFEKAGRFQIKHRLWFIIGIAIISIIGLAGLTRLNLGDNQDSWFADADQIKINQDHFEDTFGNEDAIMVLVQADDVFAPEVLEAIDRLGKRLESEVPFADSITSLMDLSISKGTEEGFEIVNPFENGIPGNGKPLSEMTETEKNELSEIKDFILSRESLVNYLVSDDATETWVILSLLPYDDTVDEYENMYKVGNAAIPILESDEFKSDKYTMKASGMAYTETEEAAVIDKETVLRVASGFIVMILCLIFFVKSFRGVIVPLIATICGIGSVLGYSSWFGIAGDSSLITLPILLGMALSVGYAIHYINAFRLQFRQSGKRKESAIMAIRETGWPILFTVITTVGSLISFTFVGIGPLKWLGFTCAAIVFAVFVYVIALIPVLLSYGKDSSLASEPTEKELRKKAKAEKTDARFEKLGGHILNARKPIIIVSLIITVIAVFGMFKMTVNMDYVKTMGEKIPYVARLVDILKAKLGSQYSYNIMIEFPEEDAFKNPENMKNIDTLMSETGKLRMTQKTSGKPRVTSVTDIVKEMNQTLNSDDKAFYTVPDEEDMLTQLLFLYEISGGENLSSWLSDDYSTTYVHVELSGYNANDIVLDIADAKAKSQEIFPDANVYVVGQVVNFAEMNNKLVIGELKSFLGSFIIIAILLILAFSSFKMGLIGMIPNLTPVVLIGGIMGYCDMPLDMLTMTIMPMILGIAVDDTIHFINHVKYHFELTRNYKEAILKTFSEIGKTLTMTTVILCAMFLMYTFSPMAMLFNIGTLAIVGLGSALIADYTLTPVLIYLTKPFGKENKEEK